MALTRISAPDGKTSAAPQRLRILLRRVVCEARLALASIGALSVFIVGAGISFLAQALAARLLSADAYGEYAYVLSCILLIASLCTLGFHVSLLKLVPASLGKAEWGLALGAIRFARTAGFLAATVAGGACAIAATWYGDSNVALARAFMIGALALPFLTLHFIAAAVVRAFGGAALALTPERILRDVFWLSLLVAISWSTNSPLSSASAVSAMVCSAILVLICIEFAARWLQPAELLSQPPVYRRREWLRLAPPLMTLTLADNLLSRSGVLVLGSLGMTRDAGLFALAFSISQIAALPRMAVATKFAPTVADLHARGRHAELQNLLMRGAALSLAGTVFVAAAVLFLARELLNWIGPAFQEAQGVVITLTVGQLICAAFGPHQHLITMTGQERTAAILQTSWAAISLFACFVLSKSIGLQGVAFALAGSLIGWNIAMAFRIFSTLNIVPGLAAPFLASGSASQQPADTTGLPGGRKNG
ncbi:MAG: lipopolysaccharide biosynthesis protein [Beijerinckiaceae bacterium]|nr:lipopolysaccharide biosynthesis protein [Beijerinckiaceae bacterium]